MTHAKGKTDIMQQVKGAVKSLPDQVAEVLWSIVYAFIGEDIGGSVHDLAMLAGKAAEEKRRQVAKFIYDVVHGVLPSASIRIGSRICIVEPLPEIRAPEGGMWFRGIIPVNWIMPWVEFIQWTCPQTVDAWEIMKLTDPYPAGSKQGTTVEEYFIFWPGPGRRTTVAEAKEYAPEDLEWAHGRVPAAIIAAIPDLAAQLETHGFLYRDVGVVTGQECRRGGAREVADAWRHSGGHRLARVASVECGFGDRYLFAFSRKSVP